MARPPYKYFQPDRIAKLANLNLLARSAVAAGVAPAAGAAAVSFDWNSEATIGSPAGAPPVDRWMTLAASFTAVEGARRGSSRTFRPAALPEVSKTWISRAEVSTAGP
jgi:hypothetical protein